MNGKQQEIDRSKFVRVVGELPRVRSIKLSTVDEFGIFSETFGPPEITKTRKGVILFWNFTRDGSDRFSLYSRVPKGHFGPTRRGAAPVKVNLVAKTGARSFWDWAADRLSAVESAEEFPAFTNSAGHVVVRLVP